MTDRSSVQHASAALDDDPIVTEVRAAREAQFAAAGYDMAEYARRLREAQAISGHPVISQPPRPTQQSAA